MKKFLLIVFFSVPVFAAPPSVKIEPLTYAPPRAERVVLKNGIVVYILEDHELPIVEITLRLKSSPALEPEPDVFEIMGSVWQNGGTHSISSSEFDRLLENSATQLSVSVDHESVDVSLSSLTKNLGQSLTLMFDLLFHPRFQDDQLALIKEQKLDELRRQNESIAEIARRAFRDVLFGPTHVYAQNPTPKTIGPMSRDVLLRAHKQVLDPKGAMLAVAGDFNKTDMIKTLEKYLGHWASTRSALPEYEFSLKSPPEGRVFFIEKDFSQSRILLGRVGPARHTPDHFALQIGDAILGGGGPSRLFSEIRSRLGLAYMVGSVYTEREGPGSIAVVCQTMAPATLKATQAVLKELDKFTSEAPSTEEMNVAKESAINSFLFGFLRPNNIVNARASNEFFGYAPDHLDTYTERIAALTTKDIFDVARKYYSEDAMKIVVVGDSKKMGGLLDSLGPIREIPLDKLD